MQLSLADSWCGVVLYLGQRKAKKDKDMCMFLICVFFYDLVDQLGGVWDEKTVISFFCHLIPTVLKKLIPFLFHMLSHVMPVTAGKMATRLVFKPRRKPRCAEEMAFWATGKPIQLASGRSLRTWGDGPSVWLIHGWESRGTTFYKLVPVLVEQGFKALVWDGPAHGDSPGESTHVPHYAQCLADDITEIGGDEQPYALLGHSFGGASFAHLSKIHHLPERLVILAAPTQIDQVFQRMAVLLRLNERAAQAFFQAVEDQSGYSMLESSLVTQDLSVDHQVLVIHDQDDQEVPFVDFEKLQDSWKKGQFMSTQGLGHTYIKQDVSVFDRIISFLRKET